MRQTEAQLLARDDRGAHLAEVLVAAGMIAVHVRVDDELDRLRRELLDGGGDLVAQRRELRVDHEDAVGPDEHADGAALAVERVELVGDLVGLDLDLAEILAALGVRKAGSRHQCNEDECVSERSHSDLHWKLNRICCKVQQVGGGGNSWNRFRYRLHLRSIVRVLSRGGAAG